MKASIALKGFPETLCTACAGEQKERKANRFVALALFFQGEHKKLESVIYTPYCDDHVDLARSTIAEGHVANDMPDLVIEQTDGILLLKDDSNTNIKVGG